MYNPYSLSGKTILVTGASSGIGRATAIECSKLGATVIITARNEERLQETLYQMEGEGHSFIACDLSQSENVLSLVSQLPPIDGFVNNAGINKMVPISFIKETEMEEIFKVNTLTPIYLLKMMIKKKKLLQGASVVYTSSLAGMGFASTANGVYTATKGAVSAFIKVAALELASKKIRVNAVCPGMIETSMIYDPTLTQEQLELDKKRYPMGRYGRPEDVAFSIIYLLSDASCWVTGTNMIVDGGISIT